MKKQIKPVLKKLTAVVAASAIAVSLAACAGSSKSAEPATKDAVPDEIHIAYWESPNAELLLKESGKLAEAYPDTKIVWTEFTSGPDIITAMQAGSIDLATIGTPPVATAIANDYPISVYYVEDIIGELEGLIVKEDQDINSLEDLKGKTIATSFGTTDHFSLLNALSNAGVDIADITLMDMDGSNIYAAWDRGDIDGAYIWESIKSKILNDGGKELISSAEVAEQGAATLDIAIVHNDFYAKYPDFVKTYAGLVDEAAQQFNNDPEGSAKLMSQGLGLTEDETLFAMSGVIELPESEQAEWFASDGRLTSTLEKTWDFLYDQGYLTSEADKDAIQNAILSDLH